MKRGRYRTSFARIRLFHVKHKFSTSFNTFNNFHSKLAAFPGPSSLKTCDFVSFKRVFAIKTVKNEDFLSFLPYIQHKSNNFSTLQPVLCSQRCGCRHISYVFSPVFSRPFGAILCYSLPFAPILCPFSQIFSPFYPFSCYFACILFAFGGF